MTADTRITFDRAHIESLVRQQRRGSKDERESAVAVLRSLESEALEQMLFEIAKADNIEVRFLSLLALYRVSPYRGAMFIVEFLQDQEDEIRYCAAGLLGDCGNPAVVPMLLVQAQTDENINVREIATFSVGKIADASVLPALYQIRDHDDGVTELAHTVKGSAEEAIQRIEARERGEPDCCL